MDGPTFVAFVNIKKIMYKKSKIKKMNENTQQVLTNTKKKIIRKNSYFPFLNGMLIINKLLSWLIEEQNSDFFLYIIEHFEQRNLVSVELLNE